MYVAEGAKRALMKDERQRFKEEEWPRVHATIQRLGLSFEELAAIAPAASPDRRPTQKPAEPAAPAADPGADDSEPTP